MKRFLETEENRLQTLPDAPYDLAIWKVVKLHRDCHIVFDNAYYSAPHRLVGQQLRVRGGIQAVRIFTMDYQLVASHERATQAGQRLTHVDHLPAELVDGITMNREICRTMAEEIGPATSQVVGQLLDGGVVDRLPTVRRLLKLRNRFSEERLEAACTRALRFDDLSYATVKRILEQNQDEESTDPEPIRASAAIFVRSAAELVGNLVGGAKWN